MKTGRVLKTGDFQNLGGRPGRLICRIGQKAVSAQRPPARAPWPTAISARAAPRALGPAASSRPTASSSWNGGRPPKVAVTSPPYNLGKKYSSYNDRRPRGECLAWVKKWGALVRRIMDEDGSFFLNVGYTARAPDLPFRVPGQLREFFAVRNVIHWVKSISMPDRGFTAGHFQPISSERYVNLCHGYVFHLTKTGSVKLDKLAIGIPYANTARWGRGRTVRDRGNVWFVPHGQNGDMKRPAELLTFVMTCGMNNIFPCRAVVEMLRDPWWDMFNPGPPAPRDWSVFDSPAPSLPRPPGTEAGRRPAPAAAVA